jgi:hypothetical protein
MAAIAMITDTMMNIWIIKLGGSVPAPAQELLVLGFPISYSQVVSLSSAFSCAAATSPGTGRQW